jgi:hypothetical protein
LNWDAIGAIGELAGAGTVVVTLFFLANQIRQSNRIARGDAEREWYSKWHELIAAPWRTPHEAAAFRRGLHNYVGLDRDEKAVFGSRLIGILDHLDALRRLHAAGMVTGELVALTTRTCQSLINITGGGAWWAECGPISGVYEYLEPLPRGHVPLISDRVSYLAE